MDFDILIATKNRRETLEVSVPLMLSQSRLPKRLIVVDASDDHQAVRHALERIAAKSSKVDLKVIESEPGTSRQRNAGLAFVSSDVVFIPDDDALWFSGVAEAVMRIYERDEGELVGGVGAQESSAPPPDVLLRAGPPARAGMRSRFRFVADVFRAIEKKLVPDPLMVAALSYYKDREKPLWLREEEAVLSGAMTGFRMSFRTKAIQRVGFDECLGRYALFEDFDAGLGVLRHYSIVRSLRARVFHYRLPEERTDGKEYGMMQILNRVYIIGKHSPPGSAAWRAVTRSSYYMVLCFLAKARTVYGRDCFRGAWMATRNMQSLFAIPKEQLSREYQKVRTACLA